MAEPETSDPFATIDLFTGKQKPSGATVFHLRRRPQQRKRIRSPASIYSKGAPDQSKASAPLVPAASSAARRRWVVLLLALALAWRLARRCSRLAAASGWCSRRRRFRHCWRGLPAAQPSRSARHGRLNKVPKIRDMLGQSEEQSALTRKSIRSRRSWAASRHLPSPCRRSSRSTCLPMARRPWQRSAANPATSRLFSGGLMGADAARPGGRERTRNHLESRRRRYRLGVAFN